jgi:hypothetical protein
MAKPTNAVSVPPGYLAASSAKTGSTRNKPSIRNAKISAKLALERRSNGVILEDESSKLAVECEGGKNADKLKSPSKTDKTTLEI